MPKSNQYFPMLGLAAGWASDSGMPLAMVLRNLCDWIMMDAFPADSLVTAAGDSVDPFDIYMSGRALSSGPGGITVGDYTAHDPRWGMGILGAVGVSEHGIREFCETADTVLPPMLRTSIRRIFGFARATNRAPPLCPEAEACAAKHSARQMAVAGMNGLRQILAGFQGKRTAFGPRHSGDGDISLEFWRRRWAKQRDQCLLGIDRTGEASLEQALEALDAEWAAFIAAETQEQRTIVGPADEGDAIIGGANDIPLVAHEPSQLVRVETDTDLVADTGLRPVGEAAEMDLSIKFAVNFDGARVVFDCGATLTRSSFQIVRCLLPAFHRGQQAGRGNVGFEFVSAAKLAEMLHVTEPSLRQAIGRMRDDLSTQFRNRAGVAIDIGAVIENRTGRGYRLNPYLLLLPALLGDAAEMGDVTAKRPSVTPSKNKRMKAT